MRGGSPLIVVSRHQLLFCFCILVDAGGTFLFVAFDANTNALFVVAVGTFVFVGADAYAFDAGDAGDAVFFFC